MTNLRHDNVALDIVGRLLVPKLDGAHDHAQLAAHLAQCAKEGLVSFSRGGVQVAEEDEIAVCALEHTERCLASLCAAACLVG